jgi:hypothetical protein
MRVFVVMAGLLGGLSAVGFAAANIPSPRIEAAPIAQAMEQLIPQTALGPAKPEIRRIHKRKPKSKTAATGTKVAMPAQCMGGKPNISARPVC